MTISPAEYSKGVRAEIEQRSKQFGEPKDYFVGGMFPAPILPQNIIVFRRETKSLMLMSVPFRHQHHRYVFITAVRGEGVVGVDTRTHVLSTGQSLLVLPFQTHWYSSFAEGPIHWVFVTFEHGKDSRLEVFRNRGALSCEGRELEPLRDFLRAWQQLSQHEDVRLKLANWLHQLSAQARAMKLTAAPEPMLLQRAADPGEWIAEINRFVFDHREHVVSLEDVARHLGVSASLVRSRFQRMTGKSLGKYVRELKLQYSCELLHDTRLSVTEIAERCGYDSVFSFSRAFASTYELSPSSYRRKYGVGGSQHEEPENDPAGKMGE